MSIETSLAENIRSLVSANTIKSLKAFLDGHDIHLRPSELRTKADICKALLRIPEDVMEPLLPSFVPEPPSKRKGQSNSNTTATPEKLERRRHDSTTEEHETSLSHRQQHTLKLLQPYTREQLVDIFEKLGATISLWVFRNKKRLTGEIENLPKPIYTVVVEHLSRPQERRNVMLDRRVESCSLSHIISVTRAEGVNIDDASAQTKGQLTDVIIAQGPVIVNKILHRLQPLREPVLDQPFLTVPNETGRRVLVEKYIEATGNDAVRQVVCCICAREVFRSDAKPMDPGKIPHPELLRPSKPHSAHVLTSGMLLYRDPWSKKVPEFACTMCLQSLSGNPAKRPPLSLSNNLWTGDVPFELRILTLCERVLVSRFFSAAYIIKLYPKSRGARGWPKEMLTSAVKGNVSSYFLNTKDIVGMIDPGSVPPRPGILAATIGVTFIGPQNIPLKFLPPYLRVRRKRVKDALKLALLPEDGVPPEVLDNMKWIDDVRVLDRVDGGYIPNLESPGNDEDEVASGEGTVGDDVVEVFRPSYDDNSSDVDEGPQFESGNDRGTVGRANLHALGVIDVNGNTIPQTEVFANALRNGSGNLENYHITPGALVNTYGRLNADGKPSWGQVEDPNHLLGCFPHLFPYGEGGFETARPVQVSYAAHAKWALQYGDRRFRLDQQFMFQVFGVIQRRKICAKASLRISRSQFTKYELEIQQLKPKDLLQASEEEKKKQPFSNPAIRALLSQPDVATYADWKTERSVLVGTRFFTGKAAKRPPRPPPGALAGLVRSVVATDAFSLASFDNGKGRVLPSDRSAVEEDVAVGIITGSGRSSNGDTELEERLDKCGPVGTPGNVNSVEPSGHPSDLSSSLYSDEVENEGTEVDSETRACEEMDEVGADANDDPNDAKALVKRDAVFDVDDDDEEDVDEEE
ncbi:hypothetical protein C8J55DRAFT_490347 [Lentinula edodes]|uniref:DUF6570 domain-containing protein n=1 Tax=Lentinula lateritia TaxID=40482 RepID=A0A9W9A7B5_9AGAR|nr:hypothetical protein C8J55DRAFT_490347 [Lentinula edodes]